MMELQRIGERLYAARKKKGLTQSEVAEKSELSDRSYADIERGNANMRVATLLKICRALNVTPDEVLLEQEKEPVSEAELAGLFDRCTEAEKRTAVELLGVYVKSLRE